MRWLQSKGWGVVPTLLAIGLGLLVFLLNPVPVQVLRNFMFDQYQRWQPRPYVSAPVRIIDIDDESLQRLGQWPWPRTRVAELISRLQEAQASAIAVDILFAEPDRTSPKAALDAWGASARIREAVSGLPDHDTVLADVIGKGRVVLGVSLDRQMDAPATPVTTPFAATSAARYASVGESALGYVHQFSSARTALPMFVEQAAGNGAMTFEPDSDGVVRRVPLLVQVGEHLAPTLSAEALRVSQGASNYVTRAVPPGGVGLEEVRVGRLTLPTTPQGEVWVYYSRPVPSRYIPAWKILGNGVSPQELKGSIVLVGTSAQGLMDLRFSAMGTALPGVEVHAQLLEQVLAGNGLQRPHWASSVEALVLVLGGALAGFSVLTCSALLALGIFALLQATLWTGAWLAFSTQGLLIDPMLPGLVLAVAFVASSIAYHYASELRQRWIQLAFSRYVSPNLVTHLLEHPDSLSLGGIRQNCSFVFTDLAGFTHLMEDMDPADAVKLLNEYLDHMIAIAFAHDGTLDRIVGDAVAIMFSAPVVQTDHRERALACALEMQRFARRHERALAARGVAFCQTRIGVHSGEVIVGNFGGSAIFDYRALGDPVNTASRLEGANKSLGTSVIVSADTLQGCPDALTRPLGHLLMVGKSHPLMAFEVLDPLGLTPTDTAYYAAYAHAFELMCHGHANALQAFEALVAQRPFDTVAALHLTRLRAGARDDLVVLAQK